MLKKGRNRKRKKPARSGTAIDISTWQTTCTVPSIYAPTVCDSSIDLAGFRTHRKDSTQISTAKDPGTGGGGEGGEKSKEGPMFSKRKGESLKSYLERVDMEANAQIMEAFRKSRKPSERRRRYCMTVCYVRSSEGSCPVEYTTRKNAFLIEHTIEWTARTSQLQSSSLEYSHSLFYMYIAGTLKKGGGRLWPEGRG